MTSFASMEIHNVGLAVAKTVEYTWRFDLDTALEKINLLNQDSFFDIQKDKWLTIKVPKCEYVMAYSSRLQLEPDYINYILPSSQESGPSIPIPRGYFDLFIIHWCCLRGYYSEETKSQGAQSFNYNPDEFPHLFLDLKYRDLHGKVHVRQFDLHFDYYLGSDPNSHNEQYRELAQLLLVASEVVEK